MIKKIYFLFLLCLLTFSCGKKDDPVYKESKILNTKNTLIT